MSEPDRNPLESLIGQAVQTLEQGGEGALAQFLARHQAHAQGIHDGLEQLRRLGILAPPPPLPLERTTYGDFRIVRRLGMGGMGVVYAAEQQSLHREVALKIVRPEFLVSPSARERFRREVDAIARLQHPGIVPILAVGGESDGEPWFAMEYVAGQTLEALIGGLQGSDPARATGGMLRAALGADASTSALFSHSYWEACTRLIQQAAITMCYVHERGVVHRDLKPSNLIVTPQGQVKVLDFGLAHVRDLARVTREAQPMGSPAYSAPEQLLGEAVDERVDVYGLGITLYELLTTRLPFPLSSPATLEQRILVGNATGVRTWNPAVPRDLEIVCATAMERDRGRRYGSMAAFAADLEAVLARRPIRARAPGVGRRLVRLMQRHPIAAIGVGAAMLVALQFPLVLWRQQARANELLATKNAELEVANGNVQARQRDAEANLQQALTAIDTMLSGTTREYAVALPSSTAMQLDLAERAMQLFAQMSQRSPDASVHTRATIAAVARSRLLADADPVAAAALLREAATELSAVPEAAAPYMTALRLLADIEARLGRATAAEATLQRALCVAEEHSLRATDQEPWRGNRAGCQASLAKLRLQAGDTPAALDLLQRAQAEHDATAALLPSDPLAIYDAAAGRELLVPVLQQFDRERARAECQRAIDDLLRVLSTGERGEPFRSVLASMYELRAASAQAQGNLRAAHEDHGFALALRIELLHEFPTRLDHRFFAGASWCNLGILASQAGHHDDALDRLGLALTALRECAAAAPRDARYRGAQDLALLWWIESCTQLGRSEPKAEGMLELGSTTADPQMLLTAVRIACVHIEELGAGDTEAAAVWRARAVRWVVRAIDLGFRDAEHFVAEGTASFYRTIADDSDFVAAMQRLRAK